MAARFFSALAAIMFSAGGAYGQVVPGRPQVADGVKTPFERVFSVLDGSGGDVGQRITAAVDALLEEIESPTPTRVGFGGGPLTSDWLVLQMVGKIAGFREPGSLEAIRRQHSRCMNGPGELYLLSILLCQSHETSLALDVIAAWDRGYYAMNHGLRDCLAASLMVIDDPISIAFVRRAAMTDAFSWRAMNGQWTSTLFGNAAGKCVQLGGRSELRDGEKVAMPVLHMEVPIASLGRRLKDSTVGIRYRDASADVLLAWCDRFPDAVGAAMDGLHVDDPVVAKFKLRMRFVELVKRFDTGDSAALEEVAREFSAASPAEQTWYSEAVLLLPLKRRGAILDAWSVAVPNEVGRDADERDRSALYAYHASRAACDLSVSPGVEAELRTLHLKLCHGD